MKMRNLLKLVLVLGMLLSVSTVAMAADGDNADQGAAVQKEEGPKLQGFPMAIAIAGACLGAGLCSIGGGFAIARIGGNCIESIARQPEAAGSMFAPMIITAAMVEGGMLFAIVVCLLGVLGI